MSKHKERNRRKKQRKIQSRWLLATSLVIILAASLWIVFSNRQAGQPGKNSDRPISRLTTRDFHSLAFSPTDKEAVFFGHHNGLLVSHNGGKDWQPTSFEDADAMALALPVSNSDILYAAGHNVFFKSTDSGKTWKSVSTNLPGLDIHGFAVDPENASQVYAYVVGFGIFGSEDGGARWTLLSANAPPSTFNLAVGENSKTLYAAAAQEGLWKSQDGGHTWTVVQNTPDNGTVALAYVAAQRRLYITTIGDLAGLYVSDDNAKSWKSLGLNGTFVAVAVSPLDPNHIVVVSDQGEVFASRDGSLTWSDR